jgi:DNA-binding transcriptional regulator YhcF (GntR family)
MFDRDYNMDAFALDLDASRSVPLYRQLAEGLRYRISSGLLRPGTRLPTLRAGSELWGVNLHTVRKAYLALQHANMVEVRRPTGTFVAPQSEAPPHDDAHRFVLDAMEEARRRFGLDAQAFAAMADALALPRATPVLHVVECSLALAGSLAEQLRQRWLRETRSHHLDDLQGIGEGPVLATYFHFNEVRSALSHRIADLHFTSIAQDPESLKPVLERARETKVAEVVLCERDEVMGPAVAADLRRLLPGEGPEVRLEVPASPGSLLKGAEGGPILFSPGSWELLTDAERARADAFPLTYHVPPAELVALGRALGLE